MDVLSINCGSSTLKWDVWRIAADIPEDRLASGSIDRVGSQKSTAQVEVDGTRYGPSELRVPDHGAAVEVALANLREYAPSVLRAVAAIGHRVVHGGPSISSPSLIDASVIASIEAASALAPLHNAPALQAIKTCRALLGEALPMVATFDTAFFSRLPARAANYALDSEIAERYGIRRYGFHGLAHRWMAQRLLELTGSPGRFITLQLGNGCSATATYQGEPIDTSMGFTPLEGLVMGTRSGDIDPAVLPYLVRAAGFSVDQAEDLLNRRSGILGLSGLSSDMREVMKAASDGAPRSSLAIEVFCYRVRKYIGAYIAALGGLDAVAFGGGIGENQAEVRQRVLEPLAWCGLELDRSRNQDPATSGGRITTDASRVQAFVIPVDESLLIARDTYACLRADRGATASGGGNAL